MSDAWFKPKTYGYGAVPLNWKGWAVTAAYTMTVIGASVAMTTTTAMQWALYVLAVAAATVAFTIVARSKTDGE